MQAPVSAPVASPVAPVAASPAAGEIPVAGAAALPEAEVPPPEEDYRRPVQLYKHWVR